jgi:pyridoxal phosphate enzyme (YggS family)
MSDIARRIEVVEEQIVRIAERCGRLRSEIRLIAVSKSQSAETVREALGAGQLLFGENRAQELIAKVPLLPSSTHWHFIGHLQKNKVRKVLPLVDLVHSVDSVELALDIDRIASELGLFPRVLLEVNVSQEATKFGFTPEVARREAPRLLALPRVQWEGLMTIAPIMDAADKARPFFAQLRTLRDQIAAENLIDLPTLSMGMSDDFEAAIEEGATLIRLGTAIFGPRGKV